MIRGQADIQKTDEPPFSAESLRASSLSKSSEKSEKRERRRETEKDKADGFEKSRAPETRGAREDRFPVRNGKGDPTKPESPQVETELLPNGYVCVEQQRVRGCLLGVHPATPWAQRPLKPTNNKQRTKQTEESWDSS